jgi:lambda family phage portal protein
MRGLFPLIKSLLFGDGAHAAATSTADRSVSINPAFNGAKITRGNSDWIPGLTSGDDALRSAWPLLHTRFRDLVQNEPSLKAAKAKLVTHIIGTGVSTFADAIVADKIDEDYCDESDRWFDRWADRECDAEGRLSWPEMQQGGFAEEIGGDAILLECFDDNPRRTVPLCYQLIEAEQLDHTKDRPATRDNPNRIVRGIELDPRNRAVAYWIYDAHPYDSSSGWTSKSTRIPASRVVHSFVPFRPSATSGVCWFHSVLQSARDLDTLIVNELTASIIASLFTVAIKRENGAGRGLGLGGDASEPTTDSAGNPLTRLGKGIIADIGMNDEVQIIQSNRPNTGIADFTKFLRQQQAMGSGLSYLRLTSDYSQSSYTSARGAHLDDQAVFEPIQEHFSRRFVMPVRERHNDVAVAVGRIKSVSARQYSLDPFRWKVFDWFPVGRDQLDPEGETDAAAARIRTGISTLKAECAARGWNYRKLLRQRKAEQELIKRYGLEGEINFSKGGGAPDKKTESTSNDRGRFDA